MPGFTRLYAGLLLGRMAGSMLFVALVLFVLQRYHSPQLAGLTALMAALPGVVVSPLAGALLDRFGRARLVVLDYSVAAAALGLIAGLSALHVLAAPWLLVIVTIASLTNPLSWAGARSLFPILAPRHLWERANGLDSSGHVAATLLASPLAGILVGWLGGEWALAISGAVYVAAAAVMLRLPDPRNTAAQVGSVLANAWAGLVYTVRNPTLRGLALTLSVYNLGNGVLAIAVPVLVLNRLHMGATTVGLVWGGMGAAGLASALVAGRFSSDGRERQMIVGGILVGAVATALLPFAGSIVVVAAALALYGVANGPFDIGLFTLRQRRTDPAWFGRAFAVSMALNSVGSPIGSGLAGPLLGWSLDVALWAAVGAALLAAVFPLLTIPAKEPVAVAAQAPAGG
ncbi:MAG TPA: MFS transporter [Candidatus Dormibacteraeota bacterium]|nr:MFS transporter [Candidatus Dormibacteraeota bacterium]